MGRRKITDEAEQNVSQTATEQSTQSTSTPSQNGDSGVEMTTYSQRMPEPLADDADGVADQLGMSRNALVNMAVRKIVDQHST